MHPFHVVALFTAQCAGLWGREGVKLWTVLCTGGPRGVCVLVRIPIDAAVYRGGWRVQPGEDICCDLSFLFCNVSFLLVFFVCFFLLCARSVGGFGRRGVGGARRGFGGRVTGACYKPIKE